VSGQILEQQHLTWKKKPTLRAIYEDYYRRIVEACVHGATLEVGGGSGNLKQYLDSVVSTDLVPTPWIDAAADAQALPFPDSCFANIVGVDVLHHIERPLRFLAEASRTLAPGGRLILLEPAITPVSGVFYRFFHPEPVDMSCDPLQEPAADPTREPFDGNQAIPTLLFGRYMDKFTTQFPNLNPLQLQRFSFFAYPLSGGFRPWALIPDNLVGPLLSLEERLIPLLGSLAAFRLLIVLEHRPTTAQSD
jgi:SAM-dependent methyltransferase